MENRGMASAIPCHTRAPPLRTPMSARPSAHARRGAPAPLPVHFLSLQLRNAPSDSHTHVRHLVATSDGCHSTTPDLLLKHSDKTFTTCVWIQMKQLKHASETLAKTPENTWEAIAKHMQHLYKNTCNTCVKHMQYPNKNTYNIRLENR
jgi:hypothetical protein